MGNRVKIANGGNSSLVLKLFTMSLFRRKVFSMLKRVLKQAKDSSAQDNTMH